MDYYHLSPAQFADRIGFQRSALSHVLSGRNNPSLDFVLKVKSSFPDINLDWLTLGAGNQFDDAAIAPNEKLRTGEEPEISGLMDREITSKHEEEQSITMNPSLEVEKAHRIGSEEIKSKEYQPVTTGKNIRKIILLYDDGSFSEHVPEK
jgi:transcriptional regulator with XRE-family HTH domain